MLSKSTKSKGLNLNIDHLYKKVSSRIISGQTQIARSVNSTIVATYWLIGYDIVEEELKGTKRARYGEEIIKTLSFRLSQDFESGFGLATVKNIRQFYLTYKESFSIGYAVSSQFKEKASACFPLSWTHYRLLMRVQDEKKRAFYEKEAIDNNWAARELERQINSLLFERLAKSKDKKGVLQLAKKGQIITKPQDSIKDPFVLEFLGIPESHRLTENTLEEALISNLRNFLLELGKGFAFVARQKRLSLEGDHFYADLVFYHTILKCYVIIDLKIGKLSHGDIEQMQLYVNYYDKECRHQGDKPTIGLIICTDKNDPMVQYTLGDKNKQIFASKYQLYLPTEEELKKEIIREQEMFIEQDKIGINTRKVKRVHNKKLKNI